MRDSTALLIGSSWALNVLSMGDQEASSMGLPVSKARISVISGATLATAGAVSIASRPENRGKTIVTLLPDTGERYLSIF